MRRLLLLGARAAISAVLLYLAVAAINWDAVRQRLDRIDARWLVAVLAVVTLQLFLSALRWREVVRHSGATVPLAATWRYCLIAQFFGQTLPSTIGGDAVRVWLLARRAAGWKIATYSVLIDRALGVAALSALVLACLPWSLAVIRNPVGRVTLVVIGAGSMAAFLAFLALGAVEWPPLARWWSTRHLKAAAEITRRLFASGSVGATMTALSLAIHLLSVAAAWSAARSIGAPLGPLQALLLVPPVILIATVPISIAGWGVREGAMMIAFSYAGLAETDGLVISVLFGAALLILGAVGGVVWIFGADRQPGARAGDGRV